MTREEAIENIKSLKQFVVGREWNAALNMAIEALKEPKRKWIPVSEQMPNEYDSVFAKLIGTDKWNNAMFRRRSDDVNVTVELEDGTRKTMTMHTTDGKWKHNYLAVRFEVIAWKPLPEPYKVGEQE